MDRKRIQLLLVHFFNAPLLTWVILGFSISYMLFFIRPIFFSSHVMEFPTYVPADDPIGIDLKQMLGFSESWFVVKHFIGDYTPLTNVFLTPLLIVNFSWAYKIVTIASLFSYVMITLVFPLLTGKKRQVSSLPMLIIITGLFSYGFQFELERGQFNVIAVFNCFLAIWIYHYHNKYRILAYILFIISVQLKIYPIIFFVMLIDNWHAWRNNIKRLLILAAVNFALFFIFGPFVFVDFIKEVLNNIVNPTIRFDNHSIRVFMTLASNIASSHGWTWVNQYSGLVQFVLLALITLCIFLIILQSYRQNQKEINPLLLLACTIGALVIPSHSYDYTLSYLAAPVAVLFSNTRFLERANSPHLRIISKVLLFIFSAAYSSTLFSYTNKFSILQNNFPALFTMLLVITFLSLMLGPSLEGKVSETIEAV
jgi:hypothetical protein